MNRKNGHDTGKAPATEKADKALMLPDGFYRNIFNLSPYAIIILRAKDKIILDVNDHFCKQSGFSREEIVGRTSLALNFLSAEDRDKMISALASAGSFENLEITHYMKDGTPVPCLNSGILIHHDSELYVTSLSLDISKLKNTEDALRYETALSDALIESLPGLFFIIDEKARIVRCNERFMAVLGKTAEEMEKMTVLDLHPQARRKTAAARIKQGFLTGSFNHEESVVVNNGAEMTLLITAHKIIYEGKPCLIGTDIDITEKKRVEDALKLSRENLEEVNIALRVLVNQRNDDQKKLEEKLRNNINDLVIPYLKKLKHENLDERSKNYISILESNLQDVLYPFIKDFSYTHKNLTPQEIQIVDLIRKGHNTKEIADILKASVNTIATHRNNIRKKLNLRKSKTNLRSHILSLS